MPVDSIDENGNTVLMHACQVCNDCVHAVAHDGSHHPAERPQTHSASCIALRCKHQSSGEFLRVIFVACQAVHISELIYNLKPLIFLCSEQAGSDLPSLRIRVRISTHPNDTNFVFDLDTFDFDVKSFASCVLQNKSCAVMGTGSLGII